MDRKILFAILVLTILCFCLYTGPAADMTAVLIGSLEELTLPPDAVRVSRNEEIIESVLETVRAGKTAVNFATSEIDGPVMDSTAIYDRVKKRYPDLEYVEEIRTHQDEDRHFLSVVIVYRYFVNNQDVFCVKPGLYMVLDQKVLGAGESARIMLSGENASAYGLGISAASPSVRIGKDGRIAALGAGIAYLRVTVTDKYDRQKKYGHTFKLHILPQDAPRIDDKGGLTAAAKKGLGGISQPILIENKELQKSEMDKALSEIGEGLTISRLNDEMTAIDTVTNSDASLPECADKIDLIEEKAEEIVSRLTRADMTDLEKETALYDYLIQNAQYDYRVYDDPEAYPFDSGTSYGPIFNGMGVCTGYAYAFRTLMKTAGMECITVLGTYEGEYHMWNIAKIDGEYLHVDPTFDSVYTHAYPGLSHTYFNQTDEQMRKDHDWDMSAYPPCTDTLRE